MVSSPFIETASGRRFLPLSPAACDVSLADIAHALSQQCRFSGHTRTHYSVAEHCVRVSLLLAAWGHDAETQLWGLLHDASEAYLVDIPLPLKRHEDFAPYRAAEEQVMRAVCNRFGLPSAEPAAVRLADATMLATEARDLMPYRPEHWAKLEQAPLPETIQPWSAAVARGQFLFRFDVLNAARSGAT